MMFVSGGSDPTIDSDPFGKAEILSFERQINSAIYQLLNKNYQILNNQANFVRLELDLKRFDNSRLPVHDCAG